MVVIKKIIAFTLFPLIVLAQSADVKEKFLKIVEKLVGVFLLIIFIVAVFAIICAGILFITARGEPEKLREAKDSLVFAIVGIGIATMAWAVAKLVYDVLK